MCAESVNARREWTTDEQFFAGSIADLAAAVLTHENLARARAQWRNQGSLLARCASPDWISVVRMSDGMILHVNEAFERESGHNAAESIGRTTMDLGMGEHRAAPRVDRPPAARRAVRDHEVEFRKKSGEMRTFLLSGHVVDIRGAKCVVTISRDVTDRRRQERLLQDIARGVGARWANLFRSLVEHLGACSRPISRSSARLWEPTCGSCAPSPRRAWASRRPTSSTSRARPARPSCSAGCVPTRTMSRSYFPRSLSRTKGIEAYVGAPLSDSSGQPLGLLAVLFKRPLADAAFVEDVLRMRARERRGERQQPPCGPPPGHHDPLTGCRIPHMRRRLMTP